MVWSNWRGAGLVMLALGMSVVALGQSAGQTPRSSTNLQYMTVHENGKSLRCRVIAGWRLPDGSRAYQLQSLTTGDMLTIVEAGQPTLLKGNGDKEPVRALRIYNWGTSNTPPAGAPLPPPEVMQDPAFAQIVQAKQVEPGTHKAPQLLPVPSGAVSRPKETIIWWEEGKGSATQPQGVVPPGALAPWEHVTPATLQQPVQALYEVPVIEVPAVSNRPHGLRPMIELPASGNAVNTTAGCCDPKVQQWQRAGKTTALGTGVMTQAPKNIAPRPSSQGAYQDIQQASATIVVEADPSLPAHQATTRNFSGGFTLRPAPLFGSASAANKPTTKKKTEAITWLPSWPRRETRINANPAATAGLLPTLPLSEPVRPIPTTATVNHVIVQTQAVQPHAITTMPMATMKAQPTVFTRMWLNMKRPFETNEGPSIPATAQTKTAKPLQMTQGTPAPALRTIYPAATPKTVASANGPANTVRKTSPHVVEVIVPTTAQNAPVARPAQVAAMQAKKDRPALVPLVTPVQPKESSSLLARWFGGSKSRTASIPKTQVAQVKPTGQSSPIKTVQATTPKVVASPVQQAKASTSMPEIAVTQAGGLPKKVVPQETKTPAVVAKEIRPAAPSKTSVAQTPMPVFPSPVTASKTPTQTAAQPTTNKTPNTLPWMKPATTQVQTAQNKVAPEAIKPQIVKPMESILPNTLKVPTPGTTNVVKNTTPDLSRPPVFPGSPTPPKSLTSDPIKVAQNTPTPKTGFFANLFGKKSQSASGTTGTQPKSIDQPPGTMAVAQQKMRTGLAADLGPVPTTQTVQGKPGYLPDVVKKSATPTAPAIQTASGQSTRPNSPTGSKTASPSTALPGTLSQPSGQIQQASNSAPPTTATVNNKTLPNANPPWKNPASTANKSTVADRTRDLPRPPASALAQATKKLAPTPVASKSGPADRTSDLPRPPQISVAQGATGLQPKTILPVTYVPAPPAQVQPVQTASNSAAPKSLPDFNGPKIIEGNSSRPFSPKAPPTTVQTADAGKAPTIGELKGPPPSALAPAPINTRPLTSADFKGPPAAALKPDNSRKPLTTAEIAALSSKSPSANAAPTEVKAKQGLIPFLFNTRGSRSEQVAQGPTPPLPRSIQQSPDVKGLATEKTPRSLSITDRGIKANDQRGSLASASSKEPRNWGIKGWFQSQPAPDMLRPNEPVPLDDKTFAAGSATPFPTAPEGTPIPDFVKKPVPAAPLTGIAQNKSEPGRLPFSTASPNDTQSGLPSISKPGAPPTLADIKPVPAVATATPTAEPVRPVVQAAVPPKRDWRHMWGKSQPVEQAGLKRAEGSSVAQANFNNLPTSNGRPGLDDILLNPEKFNPAQKPLPSEAGLLAYQKPQQPIQTVAHNVRSAPQQASPAQQAQNPAPHMVPGLPPGTQSVMAARNGMMTGVQYVPVPVVTIPEPVRPPAPPEPKMPEAPQPTMFVNAFTPPAQPNPQGQQQYGPGYPGQPGMSGPMMPARMPLMNPAILAQAYAQNPFLANPMMLQQAIQQFALLTPAQQGLVHQALYIQQQSFMMQQQALLMQQQQAMMQPQRPVMPVNYPANYQGPTPPNPFGSPMPQGPMSQGTMPAQYMQPMGAAQHVQQAMAQMPPMMPTMPQSAPMQYAQQQPPTAQQLIGVLIESPYPAQRESAAQALAAMNWRNNPQILHVLLQAARQDPAPSVRAGCIFSLSRMNIASEPVLTTLQSLQNDPDPRVRQEVQQAYARLGATRTNQ